MAKNCNQCGASVSNDKSQFCCECGSKLNEEDIPVYPVEVIPKSLYVPKRQIEETKCTCSGCGNIWFFGKKDVWQRWDKKGMVVAKNMCPAACPCFLPMIFFGNDALYIDPNKCPKCGSRAIKKEQIIHDVQ
jgi:hypothetical protein